MSQPFHMFCLHHAPKTSDYLELHRALVCGAPLTSTDSFHHDLQITGLYHLMVVSGSHLTFLSQTLNAITSAIISMTTSRKMNFDIDQLSPVSVSPVFLSPVFFWRLFLHTVHVLVLLIFALLTGFQPPVVRALMQMALQRLNQYLHLGWPPLLTCLHSGVVCVLLYPSWILSWSMILSWAASMIMAYLQPITLGTKSIKISSKENYVSGNQITSSNNGFGLSDVAHHARLYIFTFPLLLPLQPLHPFAILCNWLLSPVIGRILFPLSLCVFLWPFLVPTTDVLIHLFTWCVRSVAEQIPPTGSITSAIPLALEAIIPKGHAKTCLMLWCYLGGLHLILLKREVIKRRRLWP